jgi:hypothetical protein
MKPLKKPRMLKDFLDLGFDTEYSSEDNSAERELLSVQLSLGKGKSRVYDINRVRGVTSKELLEIVLGFLKEFNVKPAKHIYLIAHYAIAELNKISDFYDEYEKTVNGRVIKVRPKIRPFTGGMSWSKEVGEHVLYVLDLFGHLKTGLDKVGKTVGLEKLVLNCNGLTDSYWKEHMKELQIKHREAYNQYAIRDAEICIETWNILHDKYSQLGLDVHIYGTFSSITIAAFRRQMKKLPAPIMTIQSLSVSKRKDGTWLERVNKYDRFAGSLDVRELACLANWGGNNQAFAQGYFKGVEITQWDFVSLYIIAAILQPLSNEETVYAPITLEDVKAGYEGFCELDFSFPPETLRPTLPVQEDYYPKLMFVLNGHSYCMCAEVRQALTLGVNILNFRGYGFKPTPNETEHELKAFLGDMLKNKSELEKAGKKDSAEYMQEKAKMVGIIGRFKYMSSGRLSEDISRLLHESGLKFEEFRRYGRRKALRALYARSEVGGSWHVEWSSLVLGKARSLAGWAINQGNCLLISTDGGLWLGNPRLNETELAKELEKYHSGIRLERVVDEALIIRNRCYAAWSSKDAKNKYMAQGGIGVSGNSEEKKDNFEKMCREQINAGKVIYDKSEVRRLSRLNDFLYGTKENDYKSIPLNSVVYVTRANHWTYDNKRKLDRQINPFVENTFSKPFENVLEAWRLTHHAGKSGRPKGIAALNEEQIKAIKAESKKATHKELAEKYGVSVSTVKRVRR